MVKQRQMTKKTTIKRKRAQQPLRLLPARFPRAPGDDMNVPFNLTYLGIIPAGSGVNGELLVLGRGTTSTGYTFLNTVSNLFSANSQIYSRWMISRLKVTVRATGVGGTANTFIAASYIPSNSTRDSPPGSLSEVSQANHYAESSLGTTGTFELNCAEYHNDWRETSDSDDSDAQVGLIQLYESGSGGSTAQTAGVVTVSGVLHFCGLRA